MLERKAPPTFPLVIEMRERAYWVTHWVEDSVDCLLHAKVPIVQVLQPLSAGSGIVSSSCSRCSEYGMVLHGCLMRIMALRSRDLVQSPASMNRLVCWHIRCGIGTR